MSSREEAAESHALRKLQLVETEILQRLTELCEKEEITCYIIGGTLIGAVREGGFIPWDDDIDVAVPREDYEKLIRVMQKLKDPVLGMEYYRDDPGLYFYPIKIVHKGYRIREARSKDGSAHPWIDVLPIDGLPDGKLAARLFKARMMYYRLLLGWHYVDNLRDIDRGGLQKLLISFGRVTHIGHLIDPTKVKNSLDRTLKSHKIRDCKVIGTPMGANFFAEFVPKECFGKGIPVSFEGLTVTAPDQVDRYLTLRYGDYMTPPGVEQRISHKVEFVD